MKLYWTISKAYCYDKDELCNGCSTWKTPSSQFYILKSERHSVFCQKRHHQLPRNREYSSPEFQFQNCSECVRRRFLQYCPGCTEHFTTYTWNKNSRIYHDPRKNCGRMNSYMEDQYVKKYLNKTLINTYSSKIYY